jgi:hypothetical protein
MLFYYFIFSSVVILSVMMFVYKSFLDPHNLYCKKCGTSSIISVVKGRRLWVNYTETTSEVNIVRNTKEYKFLGLTYTKIFFKYV